MLELLDGIRRLTFPMPTKPGHVHCYLLPVPDGYLLVDTGLALPDLEERWAAILDGLDRPITAIAITHFHPDHVGGARDAAALTGTAVHQGTLDYEQCERVWGSEDWEQRLAAWFLDHGVPSKVSNELLEAGAVYRPFIRHALDPLPLRDGEDILGWDVVELPGHADGHLCLVRGGVLVAGDHLLPEITPAVGLYPESRPDPLGDYLESLETTAGLDLLLALPGHGEPIEDPAARAREIVAHHADRLDETVGALARGSCTAYEVSLALFPRAMAPAQRRFAVAESLSHLERLVVTGRAERSGDGRPVTYTAA